MRSGSVFPDAGRAVIARAVLEQAAGDPFACSSRSDCAAFSRLTAHTFINYVYLNQAISKIPEHPALDEEKEQPVQPLRSIEKRDVKSVFFDNDVPVYMKKLLKLHVTVS